MPGKPQFAAVPNRALWDRELTDRDVRNLAVIAAHDRLSHARGKGQGAWASHRRFAALAGTEYSRFSVSVNRLLARGYLQREPLETDRRKFTYRVVYTDEDSLPSSKELPNEIVCSEANEEPEIVCSDPSLSDCNESETDPQYIPRRVEIDSAEADKIDSAEAARFAARPASRIPFADNIGAQLARFERDWKERPRAYPVGKLDEWLTFCVQTQETYECGEPEFGQAQRLASEIELALEELTNGDPRPAVVAHG